MFKSVTSQPNLPDIEKNILDFWDENKIFQKSLDQRRGETEFVFYDGPPFATGLPHYGHLLAGTIKDVIPRYQTMRGKFVDRVFGWDCHGLPIEALAQEALGVSGTTAIEELGVDEFNEKCRSMVLTYVDEWRKTVSRMGRWVDFENGYKTMDTSFMETIWWVFKELWNQQRVYRAHRIMPYSWKLNTPLSNFEANRNYQDVQDPAITVSFKIKSANFTLPSTANTYFLAWTTTPWTLPENLALCAGQNVDYIILKDKQKNKFYILAEARVSAYYKNDAEYEIVEKLKGSKLLGATYEPLFPYFSENVNSFIVLNDSFVTTSDGTGIVHMAPAYGEEDYRICRNADIPLVDPLDEGAVFTNEVPDFSGLNCKEADKPIIKWLKSNDKLFHQNTIMHSYPFCERTDTPLIYRAIDAWYVKVTDLTDRLQNSNNQINWTPSYVGEKRFANWLSDAKDWNISRNRFWGSCIPLWVNVDDKDDIICVGSIQELEQLSGQTVTDLHKHFVDKIIIEKDGKTYKRTPEVLDCWFESGSMPYAQNHYPFSNKEKMETNFPADFIAEGLDQTRGWFYTLTVLSTAIFNKPAFKNVIVNGLILADDGQKMSKRKKNYPDPHIIFDSYGADALRLFLLGSPVVRGEDLKFSEDSVKEVLRSIIIPLWNSYSFFMTYASVDKWEPFETPRPPENPDHSLDRWILSSLSEMISEIRDHMDRYHLQKAANRFEKFIKDLTNWYIRRSRRRFWKSQNDGDKDNAYRTLHYVLLTFCKTAAPFIPFITDEIYRNLRTDTMPESVHLCDYPESDNKNRDSELEKQMEYTMQTVSLGRFLRAQNSLRVRQPLSKVLVVASSPEIRQLLEGTVNIISEELNVKTVEISAEESELVNRTVKANFKSLGPKLGRNMKEVANMIAALDEATAFDIIQGENIELQLASGEKIVINADDVIIHREEREGLCVVNEGDITVALDSVLTEDLKIEGLAREFVSRLQNIRKDIGLDVADRIAICYSTDNTAMLQAISEFNEYISNETLALSLKENETLTGENAIKTDINEIEILISLTKEG